MDMTKRQTKDLIEMYWERKCLWQVSSKEYKKRDMKKKAYHEMVAFLRRNGVRDASDKLVREKIQNLRRSMRKEKKRIDDSGGAYSPTLWYYDLLSFVNDQYENAISVSMEFNYDDDPIECNGSDEEAEQEENSSSKYHQMKTKESTKKKERKQATSVHLDEFQALGINFAAKLKRMDSNQQIFAELLIQKVLTRGLLGQLNESTELINLVEGGCIIK